MANAETRINLREKKGPTEAGNNKERPGSLERVSYGSNQKNILAKPRKPLANYMSAR